MKAHFSAFVMGGRKVLSRDKSLWVRDNTGPKKSRCLFYFFFFHLIARVQNIKNFIQVSRELNINNIVRMRCKKAFETQFQFFRLKFHLNRYLHVLHIIK
uniref:Uncharacterized protein n=1 Tax=Cacopsylla melanoneura TaxID=428564 RepID=A0A8D8SHD4_9HEMI